MRCKLQGACYVVSKRHELCSTNGFKLEVSFHPPPINSAFQFIARLLKRRSINETQPNFAKQWMVNRANNLQYRSWGLPSEKNQGQKTFYICSVFRRPWDLISNICWIKRNIEIGQGPWKARRVSYGVPKFHELWSTNGLKANRSFYPPSLLSFCPSPSHTLYAALTWRPTTTLGEMELGSSAAQIWSPKRC